MTLGIMINMENCSLLMFLKMRFIIQSLVVVEEELELPLEDKCTHFEEVHDSTTLEPTYGESFTFLGEVHVPTLIVTPWF